MKKIKKLLGNQKIKKALLRIENMSLQKKLVLSYILIILIPIITFSLYIFKQFKDSAIKNMIKENEYLLEMEKITISKNIYSMENAAQMVVSDKKFINFIKDRNEYTTEELLDFNYNSIMNIVKIQNNNPNIEHIRFYVDNNNINEIWPVVFSENRIKNKPWYNEVKRLKGMVLWKFEEIDQDIVDRQYKYIYENSAKIMLLREISYPEGEHLGIIEVDMLLKNFLPKMYAELSNQRSQMFFIDSKGNLYTNINNDFLKRNKLSLENIKEQFYKYKNNDRGSFFLENQNNNILAIYTYIEAIDSYVISLISLQDIFTNISRTRNIIILTIIFLIIILSIITNLINTIILKKLNMLIYSMKKIRQGDFNIDVSVRGDDEIGELAHHIRRLLVKINELITDAVNKKIVSKEAELRALRTQIDSHFLYNTLENIKMLAEIEGQLEISDALTSLGKMMRYNMKWASEYVTLREEIDHIKNYTSLMNIRFDNKIKLIINIDSYLLEQEVLKLSIQPIIENSISHGIKDKLDKELGIIEIKASIDGNTMIIEITDNGKGMSPEEVEKLNYKINLEDEEFNKNLLNKYEGQETVKRGNGIGLRIVNQRIKLYYGDDYGLQISSKKGEYTKVILKLPYLIVNGGISKYA
ncbi:sensor histidine kinase [Caloramator australicus]|uniref:histidine kinase n=1 Tax=Caloramator australicus RC3 TaxID=857293 RepID=I7K5Y3_9CLOT|nr:histidine kinase [Caloramator australicus]CCJ32944.1 two-component sensor histidine kinase [Caloramator australicus RC3]